MSSAPHLASLLRPASVALVAAALAVGCATKTEPPQDTRPSDQPSPDRGPAPAQGKGPSRASVDQVVPLAQKKFGTPITETSVTPLPTIFRESQTFVGRTVRTEGMVTAVCQKAGCWMQIADETGTAHIRMAGHSFFVPKDASGHRAVVQAKVLPSNEAPQCAGGDSCGEAAKVARVELEATGVEFVD